MQHTTPLSRIHATCTLWRSEIALEGWVFPSVLALVSELRSQRLESRLHRSVCPSESSSHPPTTAAPLPSTPHSILRVLDLG
jgi:hypothetical protein